MYLVGAHYNRLVDEIQICTHSISFCEYNTIQNTLFSQTIKHGNMRNDKYKYDDRGKHVCEVTILFQIMIIL